jgi:hypothetical protein
MSNLFGFELLDGIFGKVGQYQPTTDFGSIKQQGIPIFSSFPIYFFQV